MTSSQVKGENFDFYYAFAGEADVKEAGLYIFLANKVLEIFYEEFSFMENKNTRMT